MEQSKLIVAPAESVHDIVPVVAPTTNDTWYHSLHSYASIITGAAALLMVVGKCLADPSIHSSQDMLNCLIQGVMALGVLSNGIGNLSSQATGKR